MKTETNVCPECAAAWMLLEAAQELVNASEYLRHGSQPSVRQVRRFHEAHDALAAAIAEVEEG